MPLDDTSRKWAELRFAVIGQLLVQRPESGDLQDTLRRLADQVWQCPDGEMKSFGFSTIERWYYAASRAAEPTEVLRRRVRRDAGRERVMSEALLEELKAQYAQYPQWSYKLHADNVAALVLEKPHLGPAPSYTTVRRRMHKRGWLKKRKARTKGQQRAQQRLEEREVRSFEKEHVNALWHLDFHEAGCHVLLSDGRLIQPKCLGILDDFSRVCCHLQWYYEECSETLTHGLIQAKLKRGVPRAELMDNGAAMLSAEVRGGLHDSSVVQETTLPHSPYQNGKQEVFWATLEGRFMPMLTAVDPLRLEFLNRATQAWVEMEYNRSRHSELGCSPIERLIAGHDVSRQCPDLDRLRFYFTRTITRRQRQSDGTVSIKGVRFEIPSRMSHIRTLTLRYANWDLSRVYVVDPRHTTEILATIVPQNKQRNADGRRPLRQSADTTQSTKPATPNNSLPPLMRKIMADYAATGQPPAYIPHEGPHGDKNDA